MPTYATTNQAQGGNAVIPTVPTGTPAPKPVTVNTPVPTAPVTEASKPNTSFSSDTISNTTIPNNNQTLANANAANPTSPGDAVRYSNGNYAAAPSYAVSDPNNPGVWTADGKTYFNPPDSGITDPVDQQINDTYRSLQQRFDANSLAQIDALKRSYDDLIKKQQDANMRGEASLDQTLIMGGSQRYAQISSTGQTQSLFSYGLDQIAQLKNKEDSALAAANAAMLSGDMQFADKQIAIMQKSADQRQKVAQDLADKLAKQHEDLLAAQKAAANKLQTDKEGLLKDLAANGITDPAIRKAVMDAPDLSVAINATGNSLQKSSNATIQGFLDTNRLLTQQGLAPITLDTYRKKEDERATNLEYSKAYASAKGKAAGESAGQPQIPSNPTTKPYIDAFNSASIGLTAGQAKQAQNAFNNAMASGNLDDARNVLTRAATVSLPTADQTTALGRAQALTALQDIQSLMNEASAKSGIPNVVSGNIANAAKRLGYSSNEDLNYISNRITAELQTYRRAMTGVAFSPQESAQYEALFPNITNSDELNTTQIKALTDALDSNNKAVVGFAIGDANYEKIYGASSTGHLPSSIVADEAAAQTKVQSVYATHASQIDALIKANPSISNSDILQVLGY